MPSPLSLIHLDCCRYSGGCGGVLSPSACATSAKKNQDTCSECFFPPVNVHDFIALEKESWTLPCLTEAPPVMFTFECSKSAFV